MKCNHIFLGLVLLISMYSCSNKDSYDITIPPRQIKFNITGGTINVDAEDVNVTIHVGATSAIGTDETFVVTLLKNSNNAVLGTHYNFDLSDLVMKANEVIKPLSFTAIAHPDYSTGRVDTLVFGITDSKGEAPDFNDKITLIIK